MHKYFADVIDVAGDGYCGFHVVSYLLGRSVETHHNIRLNLTIELNQNRVRYLKMLGSQERFDVIKNALTPAENGPAPEDKWMMMPDMGFLLAQK
ncbi:FAR1-related protein [Trifolium medium]|uniref:FAR1-related protein n=1 Tax=Trifolium medium TaxID=97028 RepID=A0A392QY72_9FABA|nr:FAR1-related protein [Trifolium medium]